MMHRRSFLERLAGTAAALVALAPTVLELETVTQVLVEHDADELLEQPDAADLLKVSATYLRRSDCPKVLLPPARGKRSLVRYRRSQLLAWAATFEARATEPQKRAS